MKCLVTGSNVKAHPPDSELFPLCLCLLPLCPTLFPAVPGSYRWAGPAALQNPDEVLPVHLPLSGDAGEDSGKMLHFP